MPLTLSIPFQSSKIPPLNDSNTGLALIPSISFLVTTTNQWEILMRYHLNCADQLEYLPFLSLRQPMQEILVLSKVHHIQPHAVVHELRTARVYDVVLLLNHRLKLMYIIEIEG